MSQPLVMDVDTGIDDALALLLALRSPELDLLAVGTVAGNVSAPAAARNSLRVLEVAGATAVPVAVGTEHPLVEPLRDARHVHGDDGLGQTAQSEPAGTPSEEHAVDQLLRLSHEHARSLVVVAVGPLTNLALALSRDPGFADRVARVVLMGGAARSGGNRDPWAEANIASDPEAARIVFRAPMSRTMIGLDVTMQVMLGQDEVDILAASGDPAGRFAAQVLPFYLDAYAGWSGARRCAMHDPLAVAVAAHPALVETHALPVDVELRGELTRGMTVADLRALLPGREVGDGPRTDVALAVDVERARGLLLDRLTSEPTTAADPPA
jgi:inosine-uridine nucleoside N-ribohydrolase